MAADAVAVAAPAKVNLWLHVVGQRSDGYHLLDSLVAFPNFGDAIEVERSHGLSLTIDGPFAAELGSGEDNLVVRAAALLERIASKAGRAAPGVAIRLTKRLPIASGVGGGSTDAAATLKALAQLWDLDLPPSTMQELALGLGADVPVCLAAPAPTFMRGVGETLAPGPHLPPATLLLVNPGLQVSTPRVFGLLERKDHPPAPAFEAAEDLEAVVRQLHATRNDLEAPAIALAPEIGAVLERLRAAPACLFARMSGSGATCFGLFADAADARAAAAAIRAEQPSWWSGVGGL